MPLIHRRHIDPRAHDPRLYKGGDGGAGDLRAQEQQRQSQVQAAVDAINGKFGVAPAAAAAQPTQDQFTTRTSGGYYQDVGGGAEANAGRQWVPQEGSTFDDAGYQKALADWNAGQAAPAAAKTARDSMYSDISGAVRDSALRDLDQQYSTASRQNVFGLARSGLLGGSADAESGGELARIYGQGRMKAEQQGVQAGADLRNQDEQTRQHLISLAQSGLDTGTASSLAEGQMAGAAELAKSQAQSASVGDLFSNLGQAYMTNQVLRARYPNGLPQQVGYGTGAPSLTNSALSPGKGYVGVRG